MAGNIPLENNQAGDRALVSVAAEDAADLALVDAKSRAQLLLCEIAVEVKFFDLRGLLGGDVRNVAEARARSAINEPVEYLRK